MRIRILRRFRSPTRSKLKGKVKKEESVSQEAGSFSFFVLSGCPGWIRTTSKGIKNPYAAITSPDNGVDTFGPEAALSHFISDFTSLGFVGDEAENSRPAAAHHRA